MADAEILAQLRQKDSEKNLVLDEIATIEVTTMQFCHNVRRNHIFTIIHLIFRKI